MKIKEIASQIRERISVSALGNTDYVSTDNMRPGFGGIESSKSVPQQGSVTAYKIGDILFSNIRPYFRKIWLATKNGGCSADVLVIRAQSTKCFPRYLYYLFSTDNFINDYLKSCKGAKMPRGDVRRLLDYSVYLPPLSEQLRIAGILGSLDEKIELNRKKIVELEALAKTIYDYWFVQFNFPDKNGRPYKSSGGKMVYNKQLKREIPEGWRAWNVYDCGRFHRGISYSREDEVVRSPSAISVYRGNNIVQGFVVYDSNEVFLPKYKVSNSQILHRGYILIAMSSGSKEHVGKAGLVTLSYPTCAFGAFCVAFDPQEIYRYFIYNFLRSSLYKSYVKLICSGTGINNLKLDHFTTNIIAIPENNNILDAFNAIQGPLYNQIMRLDEECEVLRRKRDQLLPLLMNGQVEVKSSAGVHPSTTK